MLLAKQDQYNYNKLPVQGTTGRHAPCETFDSILLEVRNYVNIGSNDSERVTRRNKETILSQNHISILRKSFIYVTHIACFKWNVKTRLFTSTWYNIVDYYKHDTLQLIQTWYITVDHWHGVLQFIITHKHNIIDYRHGTIQLITISMVYYHLLHMGTLQLITDMVQYSSLLQTWYITVDYRHAHRSHQIYITHYCCDPLNSTH